MQITQKKFSNREHFTFEDDYVVYETTSRSLKKKVEIPYTSLSFDMHEQVEENLYFRNVGVLWLILGIFAPFWLIFGVGCLVYFFMTKTRFTVIQTSAANIFIIQNKDHDIIKAELEKRRNNKLKDILGEVNMKNDPKDEVAKFTWLAKHGVMTEEEAKAKQQEVAEKHYTDLEQIETKK